ncbi:hypothetical protein FC91_GL001664 [Schleiferilactobacillus harbinensis DSM 16991]|uniref:Uncharacterized protein n=1 Tax=Schleiferilactobacillus harbinensis DSM 16991 TaxID=1122147 RepID=A0A0R1X036_9LACO|nr:hypothetical protein FC91_GL001664 [Schleiferilactobacillus harbinensis DSM 16991]
MLLDALQTYLYHNISGVLQDERMLKKMQWPKKKPVIFAIAGRLTCFSQYI